MIATGLEVSGDAHLLELVIENLLGNAWKFTSKHERSRIEFGAQMRDGMPVFFVRDDGAGFDMTMADRLFNAFQAPPLDQRVSRHRHRPGDRQAYRSPPHRGSLGRGRRRTRRDVLLHDRLAGPIRGERARPDRTRGRSRGTVSHGCRRFSASSRAFAGSIISPQW